MTGVLPEGGSRRHPCYPDQHGDRGWHYEGQDWGRTSDLVIYFSRQESHSSSHFGPVAWKLCSNKSMVSNQSELHIKDLFLIFPTYVRTQLLCNMSVMSMEWKLSKEPPKVPVKTVYIIAKFGWCAQNVSPEMLDSSFPWFSIQIIWFVISYFQYVIS